MLAAQVVAAPRLQPSGPRDSAPRSPVAIPARASAVAAHSMLSTGFDEANSVSADAEAAPVAPAQPLPEPEPAVQRADALENSADSAMQDDLVEPQPLQQDAPPDPSPGALVNAPVAEVAKAAAPWTVAPEQPAAPAETSSSTIEALGVPPPLVEPLAPKQAEQPEVAHSISGSSSNSSQSGPNQESSPPPPSQEEEEQPQPPLVDPREPQLLIPSTPLFAVGSNIMAPRPLMGLQDSVLAPAVVLEFRYQDPRRISGWHAKSYSVDRTHFVLQYLVRFTPGKRKRWVDGDFVIPFVDEHTEEPEDEDQRIIHRKRGAPERLSELQAKAEDERQKLLDEAAKQRSEELRLRREAALAEQEAARQARLKERAIRAEARRLAKVARRRARAAKRKAAENARNVRRKLAPGEVASAAEEDGEGDSDDEADNSGEDEGDSDADMKLDGEGDEEDDEPKNFSHYDVFGEVHDMIGPESLPSSQLTPLYQKLVQGAGSLRSGRVYVAVSDQGPEDQPMLGLFAGEDIQKNEPVTTYGGVLRTAKAVRSLGKQYLTHTRRIPSCIFVLDGRVWSLLWDRGDQEFLVAQRQLPSQQRQCLMPRFDTHPMVQPDHAGKLRELVMTSGLGYMSNTSHRQFINCKVQAVTPRRDGIGAGELVLIATSFIPAGTEILSPYNNHDPDIQSQRLCPSLAALNPAAAAVSAAEGIACPLGSHGPDLLEDHHEEEVMPAAMTVADDSSMQDDEAVAAPAPIQDDCNNNDNNASGSDDISNIGSSLDDNSNQDTAMSDDSAASEEPRSSSSSSSNNSLSNTMDDDIAAPKEPISSSSSNSDNAMSDDSATPEESSSNSRLGSSFCDDSNDASIGSDSPSEPAAQETDSDASATSPGPDALPEPKQQRLDSAAAWQQEEVAAVGAAAVPDDGCVMRAALAHPEPADAAATIALKSAVAGGRQSQLVRPAEAAAHGDTPSLDGLLNPPATAIPEI